MSPRDTEKLVAKACDYLAQKLIDDNYFEGLSDEDAAPLREIWSDLSDGTLAIYPTKEVDALVQHIEDFAPSKGGVVIGQAARILAVWRKVSR